jgi:hypothetical protein
MISIKINDKDLMRDMNNIINYSFGFLEGIQKGKRTFLDNLGKDITELVKEYIDSSARVNPSRLHHVYEWYQNGSPDARLFDINYTVSNLGLSFKSTFSQSRTIKDGSRTPFYDKARIMEDGIPVTISPVKAKVLSFEIDGEQVFTKGPVVVENPGGNSQGGFESVVDQFFTQYFTQAFLRKSGALSELENVQIYKNNFAAGSKQGRGKGIETGYRWIVNAKVS